MAARPVFVPSDAVSHLVDALSIEFHWHPGLAPIQKQRNVVALHEAAKARGVWPILEVSTKSADRLGYRLSAFNLKVSLDDGRLITVESAFQGSKQFSRGGPFTDLFGKSGAEIKSDQRIRNSGPLQCFSYQGISWPLEPKTAFYDWLYIRAVDEQIGANSGILNYAGFTDIEFNPKRSINCQARSCALYVSLMRRQLFSAVTIDRKVFMKVLSDDSASDRQSGEHQETLF